jgi:hypothetical protein
MGLYPVTVIALAIRGVKFPVRIVQCSWAQK